MNLSIFEAKSLYTVVVVWSIFVLMPSFRNDQSQAKFTDERVDLVIGADSRQLRQVETAETRRPLTTATGG